MKLAMFTIVARNYLSLALTLGDSVVRHHPEASFRIYVVDGLGQLPSAPVRHRLVDVDEALGTDLRSMQFRYNVTEYCTAVKPLIFEQLFAQGDHDFIHYLDPDTCLFGRLDAIVSPDPQRAIHLAPHLLECRLDEDHAYPEYKHLWEGIFNLGYCGLRRTPEAMQFLAWWSRRLQEYCYADYPDGLHTDQKWADYAPVYFEHALSICRHPGLNTAHWNLHERRIERDGEGYTVNGQPLLLFHYSGFDYRGDLLCRNAARDDQMPFLTPAVCALAEFYRRSLRANGYEAFIAIPYRHNFYDNGDPITPIHRRLYRAWRSAREQADPASAQGRFHGAMVRAGLIDKSSAARAGYVSGSLPTLSRLTRIAQTLMRAFLKMAGARRYGYLMKLFMRYGRPEQHVFLLDPSHEGRPFDARRRAASATVSAADATTR